MTYLGAITAKDVGCKVVTLQGRAFYLPRTVEPGDVGRYVWLIRTPEGARIEIENDEQYAKRIKAANRRHRGG